MIHTYIWGCVKTCEITEKITIHQRKKLRTPSGYCRRFWAQLHELQLFRALHRCCWVYGGGDGAGVALGSHGGCHGDGEFAMKKWGFSWDFIGIHGEKPHEQNHGFDWIKNTGISRHVWYVEPLVWWANTIQVKVKRLGGERYIYIYIYVCIHTCYMVFWSFSICIWCTPDCRSTHI